MIENRYSVLILLCCCCWIFSSCQKNGTIEKAGEASLEIHFHPLMQQQPLVFGKTYQLPNGEEFEPAVFRFYAGQLSLSSQGNNTIATTGEPYFLLDAANPQHLIIETRVPAGTYHTLHFLLGVDSARNVSGVQSGALDPLKGMFWTWNSGYIFAKLEGMSPDATTPGNMVEYHIGGFRVPYNAARQIELVLPSYGALSLNKGQKAVIHVDVELENWFNGPYALNIAKHAVCMTPGELAWNISRNLSGLFTVTNYSIEE